jgi:hypothetical protein
VSFCRRLLLSLQWVYTEAHSMDGPVDSAIIALFAKNAAQQLDEAQLS